MSERSYDPARCAVFRTSRGPFGIFSNFHPGYPIRLPLADGRVIDIDSTETLYQADKLRDHPDMQARCLDAAWNHSNSPRGGKDFARAHQSLVSDDWAAGRSIVSMRYALRLKLAQHRQPMLAELERSGDRDIVELSTRDRFWGASPQPDGTLKGNNFLGRLVMELRATVRADPDFCRFSVDPPAGAIFLGQSIARWVRPAGILNAHACGTKADGAIYVGRPSPWGNPFAVGKESEGKMPRGQAVLAFARHLAENPDLVARARAELAGRDLICWCAPQPCHAEILRHVAAGNDVPDDPQAFLDSLRAAPPPETAPEQTSLDL